MNRNRNEQKQNDGHRQVIVDPDRDRKKDIIHRSISDHDVEKMLNPTNDQEKTKQGAIIMT